MAITPSQWSHVLTIPESYTPSAAASGQTLVVTESVIAKLPASDQATFWANVQNGGGDVRICENSDGTNQLPIEVVSLDSAAQKCTIWTRKPTYSGTGNLYLFIGKAGETQPPVTDPFGRNAVWVDFEYRFHFSALGELVDSTGKYSLNEVGQVLSVTGKVGEGADAQRDNANYHEVAGYTGVSGGAARTHSMWFKSGSNAGMLEYGTSATAQRYTVRLDGGRLRTEIAGSFTRTNNTGFADNAWHKAVTKEDGSGIFPSGNTLIVDGVTQGVNTGSNITLNTTPNVNLTFNNVFAINPNSQYDEYGLRLFKTTDALDATEYANQNDPASFFGTPTLADAGGVTVTPELHEFTGNATVNVLSFAQISKSTQYNGQALVDVSARGQFAKSVTLLSDSLVTASATASSNKVINISGGATVVTQSASLFEKRNTFSGNATVNATSQSSASKRVTFDGQATVNVITSASIIDGNFEIHSFSGGALITASTSGQAVKIGLVSGSANVTTSTSAQANKTAQLSGNATISASTQSLFSKIASISGNAKTRVTTLVSAFKRVTLSGASRVFASAYGTFFNTESNVEAYELTVQGRVKAPIVVQGTIKSLTIQGRVK